MSRRLSTIIVVAAIAAGACGKSSPSATPTTAAPSTATPTTAAPASASSRGTFKLKQPVCTSIPLATVNAALGTQYATSDSSMDNDCHYRTQGTQNNYMSILVYRYQNDGMVDWKASMQAQGSVEALSGVGDEAFFVSAESTNMECISHKTGIEMQVVAATGAPLDEAKFKAACGQFIDALTA